MKNLKNLSKISAINVFNELSIRYARKNLIDFTRKTFKHYVPNWHHYLIADRLELVEKREITRLIISMPPRYGKSELASVRFPAWYLGKRPLESIIAASYSSKLAEDFGKNARNTVNSDEYKEIFNITLSGDSAAKQKWTVISEEKYITGEYFGTGVGGAATGKGANLLLIDDPVKNRQDVQSEILRENVWDWYTSTAYTRLEKDGVIVLIMTRWHEDDLAGRLINGQSEYSDKWEVLNLPAIAEENEVFEIYNKHYIEKLGTNILTRKEGEPLWAAKFNIDNLIKTRIAVGSYDWNSLYQQNPLSAEGNIFKREWFKFYKEPPPNLHTITQSWDCAFKDNKDSDYVVGQVWGKSGIDCYLLDQVRGKMNIIATMQAIRNLSAKYPNTTATLIEDKANGTAVIEMLKSELTGIIPVEPEGGKIVRAQAAAPLLEAGNIYLPDPAIAPWINDFIFECCGFPNTKNDDQVDAMTQALARIGKKVFIMENPENFIIGL